MIVLKERPRPEYAARCETMEVNPVTGIEEPYFPQQLRMPRLISGYAVIILMVNCSLDYYNALAALDLFDHDPALTSGSGGSMGGRSPPPVRGPQKYV